MPYAGLIYDIGMFDGIDTQYFLHANYKVIAVEAAPDLVKKAAERFQHFIDTGQLIILNNAVADTDGQELHFNISDNAFWNSLVTGVADRCSMLRETITVKSIRLSTIIQQYGVPLYCKIDVEGYDAICASTLQDTGLAPKYISLETECIGENDRPDETVILRTLDALHTVGYNQFKLVDQLTLQVLELNKPFYGKYLDRLHRLKNKKIHYNLVPLKSQFLRYRSFYTGATGVFGADLGGSKWYAYEEARQLILQHRAQYFSYYRQMNANFSFWCDWHAKWSAE